MYMNYMAFMSALVLEESKWDFEEKYDALNAYARNLVAQHYKEGKI